MANPNFDPMMSTDSIWRGIDDTRCLTDDLDAIEADISTLETGKADSSHTHSEYAAVDHSHDAYAAAVHSHSEYSALDHTHDTYANVNHAHDGYALASDVEQIETLIGDTSVSTQISSAIATKADSNHTHSEYAEVNHSHDEYALTAHTHTEYAAENHEHNNYASTTHTHDEYASTSDIAQIQTQIGDTSVSEQINVAVAGKANTSHTHAIADVTGLSGELDAKYEKPSTGIAKTDLASDVQTSLGKADTAVQSLSGYATESYVDTKVSALVDSSPETMNTLNELAAALGDDPNFATTVATQIGTKVDKVAGKELSSNDYTDTEKTKLSGIAEGANKTIVDSALDSTSTNPVQNKVVNTAISNLNSLVGDTAVSTQISTAMADKADVDHTHSAYINQNAYSNVKVGDTTIAADSATDTLTLVAGNNVTITPDATNDSITIAATDTIYTHPATSGNKHIPSGGSNGQVLRWSADGTAVWGADNDTTYSAATTSANGLMSATDKTKLDGIATGANKTVVDSALSSTSTNPVQNKVVNAAIENINSLIGDTDVSTQIAAAVANKANTNHTHSYAGSSSVGGAATSANKLNTNAGGATQPVYFANGIPKATTYTLGKSVPSNAVFTDTTYGNATTSAAGLMSAADKAKLDGIAEGATSFSTAKSITLNTEGWYRVATSAAGIYNCLGTFRLNGWRAGYHTSAIINAGTNYGRGDSSKISVLHCGVFADGSITKARLVYHTTYSGNYAYLELYVVASADKTTTLNVEMSNDFGWTLLDPIAGSIPSGYISKEVVLADMAWSDVTVTAAELNYMDGVTSNVQTQLNNKFNTSGGTITGNVIIDTGATSAIGLVAPKNSDGEQAYSRIYKNASATADYGLQLRDYTHGDATTNSSCALMITNSRSSVKDKLQLVEQINGNSTYYKLYGEHNLPTLNTLGVTATATELNYVDGVTSNIQTQLNNKAASSHTHAASEITSGTLNSNRLPTIPITKGGTGATSAVSARENLGIYVYTGYITTSSSVAANGLLSDYVSAKTLFGFSTVPSNFMIVSATSRSTYFSCNIAHEKGSDSINIKMRNVSGASAGATNYYYTIVGMLV